QRSFHKHGPLLIIDFCAKQRGATCWVSGKTIPFRWKVSLTGVGRIKGGILVPTNCRCPSSATPYVHPEKPCAKVTIIANAHSPTHNPTRRVLAANAEFGFHTMSVDL